MMKYHISVTLNNKSSFYLAYSYAKVDDVNLSQANQTLYLL